MQHGLFRHFRECGNPHGYITEIIQNIFLSTTKKIQNSDKPMLLIPNSGYLLSQVWRMLKV